MESAMSGFIILCICIYLCNGLYVDEIDILALVDLTVDCMTVTIMQL